MPINETQHPQHLVEETLIILGGFLSLGTEVGGLAEMMGYKGFTVSRPLPLCYRYHPSKCVPSNQGSKKVGIHSWLSYHLASW